MSGDASTRPAGGQPRRVAVYGASGHGKVVADIAQRNGFRVVAFVDDDPAKSGATHFGAPVLTWSALVEEAAVAPGLAVALGVGDNARRAAIHARLASSGLEIATLVHPSAVVAPSSQIGAGTVVMAGAVVNPDAVVGEGCILNTGAIVEHDNRVGSFAHLSPNAALGGGVAIGDRTHVGLGAVVLPGVVVGADVRVGAGAVVHRAVPDGMTVAGVPARPLAAGPR